MGIVAKCIGAQMRPFLRIKERRSKATERGTGAGYDKRKRGEGLDRKTKDILR